MPRSSRLFWPFLSDRLFEDMPEVLRARQGLLDVAEDVRLKMGAKGLGRHQLDAPPEQQSRYERNRSFIRATTLEVCCSVR